MIAIAEMFAEVILKNMYIFAFWLLCKTNNQTCGFVTLEEAAHISYFYVIQLVILRNVWQVKWYACLLSHFPILAS